MATPEGIVILGAPRSGTTLVRRLLGAHPEIACPAETYVLLAASRFLRAERFGDDLSIGVEAGLGYSGFASDEIAARLREFAFGFLREICAREGKRRWAEKTAFGSFHLDGIERVCGDECQYLCVYRHGLDVACSIQELVGKMEIHVEELHPYVARYPRPLEAYARAWVDVATRMRRLEHERPDQVLAVRYEDLIADPKAELERIFSFLEAPADVARTLARAFEGNEAPPGLGDWKTYQRSDIGPESVGRWRGLSDASRRILGEVCNPTLETLGYERVPLPPVASDEASRHRLQLGLMVARLKSRAGAPDDE